MRTYLLILAYQGDTGTNGGVRLTINNRGRGCYYRSRQRDKQGHGEGPSCIEEKSGDTILFVGV